MKININKLLKGLRISKYGGIIDVDYCVIDVVNGRDNRKDNEVVLGNVGDMIREGRREMGI